METRALPGWAKAPALLLVVLTAKAAVIRGVILDHYSGRPIQRALVTLRPVAGRAQGALAMRSLRSGQFTFSPLPGGAYLISVSRAGYATLYHGQKAWNAPARPVFIGEDDAPFLELPMHRLGAVAGMVLDENDIGFPNVDVLLYKPTRPPVLIGQTKTDERGGFRIGGLQRGRYLVRSGAAQLEDNVGILPTFHRESPTVAEARLAEAEYDQQFNDAVIRPSYGRLLSIHGQVAMNPGIQGPVTLTLASDMGRRSTAAAGDGDFSFDALAPGQYELFATSFLKDTGGRVIPAGSHTMLLLDKDLNPRVEIKAQPEVYMSIEDTAGRLRTPRSVVVQARPRDLAGEGPVQTLRGSRLNLAPGRWEFLAVTPSDMYPVSIADRMVRSRKQQPGGMWTELLLPAGGHAFVTVLVSSRPATLSGRVRAGIKDPAIGAPVFLEPLDGDGQRRVMEPLVTTTGMDGEYSFAGLAPGRYRLASSFEFLEPDEDDMLGARPKLVTLQEGAAASEDLELWVRP